MRVTCPDLKEDAIISVQPSIIWRANKIQFYENLFIAKSIFA